MPIGDVISRYYVRLSVVDKPGVIAKISAILGAANIGISSVFQPESHEGDSVQLNREGLLQVDKLLHEFFLPEHRNARYA